MNENVVGSFWGEHTDSNQVPSKIQSVANNRPRIIKPPKDSSETRYLEIYIKI